MVLAFLISLLLKLQGQNNLETFVALYKNSNQRSVKTWCSHDIRDEI